MQDNITLSFAPQKMNIEFFNRVVHSSICTILLHFISFHWYHLFAPFHPIPFYHSFIILSFDIKR